MIVRLEADTVTGEDALALLDVEVLHARARAAARASDWDAQWRAMIDYAGRKGWLSAGGRTVQAHIEPVG
ncbi:hypothetical protein [Pseudonocardia asaccharolytica]|uniref:Uncharacterized protein n=1 Tax=Pseudonocardia asaccharolytica DSM 44247 = NBRC 16224 TaxID=1123024 RepID=A0A511D152_9PSEU|nr:hypothetical protein [Pseudonocardia asaccharolytica]GEL17264.1 hypothetical protein PA7_11010 [Pseudonocardia asaccharolytica DSM 44247 = NBRC 16224]